MVRSSSVSHISPLNHLQPPLKCLSPTGHKNHPFDCSYITDLPHVEEISCSNPSSSPMTPLTHPCSSFHCVSRDKSSAPTPYALFIPPFHSSCCASRSGAALRSRSSIPSSHGNNLLVTGPEYADWLIQLQLLSL